MAEPTTGNQNRGLEFTDQVLFAYGDPQRYILAPKGMNAQEFLIRNGKKFPHLGENIQDVVIGVQFGLGLEQVDDILKKIDEQGKELDLRGLQEFLKYTMRQALIQYQKQYRNQQYPDMDKVRKYASEYGIKISKRK